MTGRCVVVELDGVRVTVHDDGELDAAARLALAELAAAARRRFLDLDLEAERHTRPPDPVPPLELDRRQRNAELIAGMSRRP
jgi:hypothetical protein